MSAPLAMSQAAPTGLSTTITDLPAPLSQSSLDSNATTEESHDVEAVQGTGPRGLLVTLYFDEQTGLLLRELRYGNSPIGRVPTGSIMRIIAM